MLRIETERLILRPLALSDEDDLCEYQSHPEVVRYIPWPERTREQVREALEKLVPQMKVPLAESGDFILLAWELKGGPQKGKVIGQSNLGLERKEDQYGEIGYVTHQDFQRQGYAYEATKALMEYAFKNFPLHRLGAWIDTRNPESAKLAEKLGMRREAELIESDFFKGDWCNMWVYAILKREFQA
jgi:RimJ/RimL family protein N-acetyltransferase